jgi:hypothetical protein
MQIATAFVLALFAWTHAAQTAPSPTISPYFDRIDDGPAFFVICRNNTTNNVSSVSTMWPSSDENIRLDGKPLPPLGRLAPGLSTEIEPEKEWRGIIVLRQSEQRYYPAAKYGAFIRSARVQSLSEGRHTIAVRCAGTWSDEFSFYWDGEKRRKNN